jgi:hypothetical protein
VSANITEEVETDLQKIYALAGETLRPPMELCGIYHLISDGEVVYVGQTTNILCRIGVHMQQRRMYFDSVRFFACSAVEMLDDQEELHIELYSPKFNDTSRRRPGMRLETRLARVNRKLQELWRARKTLQSKIDKRNARRGQKLA